MTKDATALQSPQKTGPNFDDEAMMAIHGRGKESSCSLTALDTVNSDLAVRSVALAEADGQITPPSEIQISPPGRVQTESKGEFLMDAQARAAVIAAFEKSGRQMVIDYEHQSLTGSEAPAAGWITALEDRGDRMEGGGLWARVTWTERGAGYLRTREYRYLSPVLLIRGEDRRAARLHSVALTNTPEIQRLQPLVLAQGTGVGAIRESPQHTEEERMREQLIKLMKLAADATDEAIIAAVAALADKPALAPELREALALSDTASLSEATASIHALRQSSDQRSAVSGQLTALQAEVKTLRDAAAMRTRDELVAMALSQGKITPAQREWAEAYALRDPEGFRTFTTKAPVVTPIGDTVTLPLSQDRTGGIDEAQKQINRALGIDQALWLKHQPKGGE